MSLTKTSLWRLKPGSEVLLGATGRGYTKGGSIKIERVFEDMDCPKYGITGAKLVEMTATIVVNFLQYDSNTKDIIFKGTRGAEPTYYSLTVTYVTREASPVDKAIVFNNVYVLDTGEIPIEGRVDVPFPVTFKAIQNSSGVVYTYP
jgi:hypothetical protein